MAAARYAARPKVVPRGPIIPAHYRVWRDKIDRWGSVTLRHNRRLHHIGLGTRLADTPVSLLIDDLHIRTDGNGGSELLIFVPQAVHRDEGAAPAPVHAWVGVLRSPGPAGD